MTESELSLDEARAKLKAHFPGEDSAKPEGWEALWQGSWLPWDRGLPNPALEDLLASPAGLLGPCVTQDKRRKTALVPGCGRGYDVLLLASFGYNAFGLEVSESAVKLCFEEKRSNGDKYQVKASSVGAGNADFIKGNFFEDGWIAETTLDKFDIIYDYTFLCALPPSSRPDWASRMSKLLNNDGHLVCLEFPSGKDPKLGGPPFALPELVYQIHLAHPGENVPYKEDGRIDENHRLVHNNAALKRVARWQPRTHEIGKGQDWISLWTHS